MKTVTIRWTETSEYETQVQVPDSFDQKNHDQWDLPNDLAELDEEGFVGLTREVDEVFEEDEHDEDATEFHPTRL